MVIRRSDHCWLLHNGVGAHLVKKMPELKDGPSWHGPIFMWAELVGAELVLGRVVLHPPALPHSLPTSSPSSCLCINSQGWDTQKLLVKRKI